MRSITTTGQKEILWTDENVGEVIPDIVSPFSWSILGEITNSAFKDFLKTIGINNYPREGLFGLYRGKVYFNNTAFNLVMKKFYISSYFAEYKNLSFSTISNLFVLPFQLVLILVKFLKLSKKLPFQIQNHFSYHNSILNKNTINKKVPIHASFISVQNLIQLHKKTMFYHLSGTIIAEIFYQLFNKISRRWLINKNISADKLLVGLSGCTGC